MYREISLALSFFISVESFSQKKFSYSYGAIVRGDSTKKELSVVFTADEFGEGLFTIIKTLKKEKVKASFFFTGRFYRDNRFQKQIETLNKNGHYLGPHSSDHLLYCDWVKRDSLLVTRDSFEKDIKMNLDAMRRVGLTSHKQLFFIPPFEWWNDSIATWGNQLNLILFSFTPGIRTAVDYTWPQLNSYKSSEWIVNHLQELLVTKPNALNGSIILIHAGTDPRRTDKFYNKLGEIIKYIKQKGYQFKRIDSLLNSND